MWEYIELGLTHITDHPHYEVYDHILFIVALVAGYSYQQWRPVIGMATMFTIGHSISLALAVSGIASPDSFWVEFGIQSSIIVTCLLNLFYPNHRQKYWPYLVAAAFGIIHGFGFAGYLSFMLSKGQSIALPLLGFNIGIEIGQILILLVFFVLNGLYLRLGGNQRWWTIVISIIAIVLAAFLLYGVVSSN